MQEENPFDILENAVKKEEMRERAKKAIEVAMARVVLGQAVKNSRNKEEARGASAFFSTLALRMTRTPDESIPTAATDGKNLRYNPGFIVSLPDDELIGVIVHEVMHIANKHHCRRGQRHPGRWNIAIDLAINSLLRDAGIPLPSCGVYPGEGAFVDFPKGLSGEAYYPMIPEDMGGGEPGSDPGGCGGVVDPGDGSDAAMAESEADTSVAVAQAHSAAKLRGKSPAFIDRLVEAALEPIVDWRRVLADFLTKQAKNDYRWTPPNRRHVHQGLYLPSIAGEELGEVVIAFDTSGSIGQDEMARFASEIQGILDAFSCKVTILYHDCVVAGVQEWRSDEGSLKLDPKGGGGTSHVCVFEWLKAHPEVEPVCMVCFTDLYTEFPKQGPDFPVLWCVHNGPEKPSAPFGQCVVVP